MALNLTPEHVASKEKVGKLNDQIVWEIATTGGLYVNVIAKGASFEVIGTGPHPAIAKHIASQRCPSIVWTKLKKSDSVPFYEYEYLLPKYEEFTNQLRKAQGL